MNDSDRDMGTGDGRPRKGRSSRPFLPPHYGRFCVILGLIVLPLCAVFYFFGVERFWWLAIIAVILCLCALEGILGDAADRQLARVSPATRNRIWWVAIIGAIALAVFLFIRGVYFHSP